MKLRTVLTLSLILITLNSLAQNDQWFAFQLDSLVIFQLPAENADLFNGSESGIKMYELSARSNGVIYTGNKMSIDKIERPNSSSGLEAFYESVEKEAGSRYPNSNTKNELIEKNGLIGYKTKVTDTQGNSLYESELYVIEDSAYLFNCFLGDNKHIENSDYFFDQLILPASNQVNQLTGSSTGLKMFGYYKTEIFIVIGVIVLIFLIIALVKKTTYNNTYNA